MAHKKKRRGPKNARKIIAAYCEGWMDIDECCRRLGPRCEELIKEHTGGLSKDELQAVMNDWTMWYDEVPWYEFMPQQEEKETTISQDEITF